MSVLRQPNFCGAIVGKRKSGKTTLFVDLLRSVWKNRFAFIVWISPTAHLQKWIWKRIDSTGFITLPSINQQFLTLLKSYQSEHGDPRREILIVFDDVGMEARNNAEDKHDELTQMAFAGRHFFISCLFLAQRFTQLPPSYRSQLDFLIFFGTTNNRELNLLHAEFAEEDIRTFRERLNQDLMNDDYTTMLFMNKNGKRICTCLL